MKLNNLQVLRGISAILVCYFHFRGDLNFENSKAGDLLFSNGSISVPIRFVISGFTMVYTTRKLTIDKQNTFSTIVSYFKKRIIRIVPLYYILTFAWILLGGGIALYITDSSLLSRLIHSLLFLPHKNLPPVLYLGWSLNFEMFFYAIFGISLFFTKQIYIFIILFFILTYIVGNFITKDNPILDMITSSLNLYFVMGILLIIILDKVKFSDNLAIAISAVGILLFCSFFFNLLTIKHELLIILIVSGFVFSFLLFDYFLKINGNRFLVFLGDISYSLYLSHPFVDILLRRYTIEQQYLIPFFIFKLSMSIAVAGFLYYFIEKKITNYLKMKLKLEFK